MAASSIRGLSSEELKRSTTECFSLDVHASDGKNARSHQHSLENRQPKYVLAQSVCCQVDRSNLLVTACLTQTDRSSAIFLL